MKNSNQPPKYIYHKGEMSRDFIFSQKDQEYHPWLWLIKYILQTPNSVELMKKYGWYTATMKTAQFFILLGEKLNESDFYIKARKRLNRITNREEALVLMDKFTKDVWFPNLEIFAPFFRKHNIEENFIFDTFDKTAKEEERRINKHLSSYGCEEVAILYDL